MGWGHVRHTWLVNSLVSDFIPSAHRRGDKLQNQLRSQNLLDDVDQTNLQTLTQPKGRKKVAPRPLSESDDDNAVPPMRASREKPPSRLGSVQPQKERAVTKKKPLFLDSDDEANHNGDKSMDIDRTGDGFDEEQTLQSSYETSQTVGRRSMRETKSRKPAPIIVDDDSDDDAVFKGFKGQKRGR